MFTNVVSFLLFVFAIMLFIGEALKAVAAWVSYLVFYIKDGDRDKVAFKISLVGPALCLFWSALLEIIMLLLRSGVAS